MNTNNKQKIFFTSTLNLLDGLTTPNQSEKMLYLTPYTEPCNNSYLMIDDVSRKFRKQSSRPLLLNKGIEITEADGFSFYNFSTSSGVDLSVEIPTSLLDSNNCFISNFDIKVQNAILTICKKNFDINDNAISLYKLTQVTFDNIERPTPKMINDVKRSLKKQSNITLGLEFSKLKEPRSGDNKLVTLDEIITGLRQKMISYEEVVTVDKTGREREYIQLLKYPPLITYAEFTGHLIAINSQLLTMLKTRQDGTLTDKKARQNTRYLEIKSYIVEQISIMNGFSFGRKNQRKKFNRDSNIILITSLLKHVSPTRKAEDITPKQRRNILEIAKEILDNFKQQKSIENYNMKYNGKKMHGYEIILKQPPKNKK